MTVKRVTDDIYSVGVLNPTLRLFDIIMVTEYGTSYNSYIVKGEKTALIDAVHENYFDELVENINEVSSLSQIDYLIVNHTEPDHSGSISLLLDKNPDIHIYCTAAAYKYLKNIVNRDFQATIVKQGDTLNLGNGHVLEFIPAPFLHWPDTMFTYDKKSAVLFSCDFFGSHFCEPSMLDRTIKKKELYEQSREYYFRCIFSPYKSSVLTGLDKIKNLKLDYICTSHGPILTDTIEEAINKYREWATLEKKEKPYILIPYASAYGYTKMLAKKAYDTLINAGYYAECVDMTEIAPDLLSQKVNSCSALLIGTNTINRDATKPVWDLLASIDGINSAKKPAGAFGSYGWSGEAVTMVKARLESLRFKFIGDGYKVNFRPTEEDLVGMGNYALAVAAEIKKE